VVFESRSKKSHQIASCKLAHSTGMTLLEVLIAVILFAVFSGTFLMVTEMIGQLFPLEKTPLSASSCNGPALEASCINIAFDAIVPRLEKADPDNLDISGQYLSPNQMIVGDVADMQLAWPDDYKLEILRYTKLEQSKATETKPARPGLYLLQAKPINSAFWRKPMQRLFCRPYYRCIRP